MSALSINSACNSDKSLLHVGRTIALCSAGDFYTAREGIVLPDIDFSPVFRSFAAERYPEAKSDLATVFFTRMQIMVTRHGGFASVMPQGFLYKDYYSKFREQQFGNKALPIIARLGSGAFSGITGEEVKVCLVVGKNRR